jgi:uncharacterized protein with GYD domain
MSNQLWNMARDTANELEQIAERLEEIRDWAEEMGLIGTQHKVEEGVGRIWAAAEAAEQGVGW